MKKYALSMLLLAGNAFSQDLKIEKYTLPNGMRVILNEDHSTPDVAVNLLVRVGSRDEPAGRSGFAHLVEHLMFRGTGRVPEGEYEQTMGSLGATFNARTHLDYTAYYATAPAYALPTLLWLEADRLEGARDHLTQQKLEVERNIVLNERALHYENTPFNEVTEAIKQLVYPSTHPYHTGTIGKPADLKAATLDEVRLFLNTHYIPNNLSLVVTGRFKTEQVKPLVDSLFGTLPRQNDVARKDPPGPWKVGVKRVTFVNDVKVPRSIMAFRGPGQRDPGYPALLALQVSVQELLHQYAVRDVEVRLEEGGLGSLLYISAVPGPGRTLEDVEQDIEEVVQRLRTEPNPGLQYMQAIATSWRESDLENLNGRALLLNLGEFYHQDPLKLFTFPQVFRDMYNNAAEQVAREVLDLHNRVVARVVPRMSQPTLNPRDQRPANFEVTLPQSIRTEFRLQNQIPVQVWQVEDARRTHLLLNFPVGAANEPHPAVVRVLSELLWRHVGPRSHQGKGVQVDTTFSPNQLQLVISTPDELLEEVMEVVQFHLSSLPFDEGSVNVIKHQVADQLRADQEHPFTQGLRAIKSLYFAGHPLETNHTPEQVQALTWAQVKDAYTSVVHPGGVQLLVATRMDPRKVQDILNRTAGEWSSEASLYQKGIPPFTPGKAKLRVLDRPGATQTSIQLFSPLPLNPDNAVAFQALSEILAGSGMVSRLHQSLRETLGATYGVSYEIRHQKTGSGLWIQTSVDTASTGKALQEILQQFRTLKGSITVLETERTRALLGSATWTQSLSGFLQNQALWQNQGYPHSFEQGLEELTPEQLNRIPFPDAPLVWVLVGNRKEILRQLEGLGLPEVEAP